MPSTPQTPNKDTVSDYPILHQLLDKKFSGLRIDADKIYYSPSKIVPTPSEIPSKPSHVFEKIPCVKSGRLFPQGDNKVQTKKDKNADAGEKDN